MDQVTGNAILKSVREKAMADYKPFDVVYARARWLDDPRFVGNPIGRQHYREYLADKFDGTFHFAPLPERLANLAANKVTKNGSTAHIFRVGYGSPHSMVEHAFCVADYKPGEYTARYLSEINIYNDINGWCIDPWANISCSLCDYRDVLYNKTFHWSSKVKRIIYRKTISDKDPNEIGMAITDATDFHGELMIAELDIQPASRERGGAIRGLMIKSARSKA